MKKFLLSALVAAVGLTLSGCSMFFPIHDSAPALPFDEADDATTALLALNNTCPGDHWSSGVEGEKIDEITCDGGFEAINTKYFYKGSERLSLLVTFTPFRSCDELLANAHWNSTSNRWVFGSDWLAQSQSEQFSGDVLAKAVKGETINFAEWACGENGYLTTD